MGWNTTKCGIPTNKKHLKKTFPNSYFEHVENILQAKCRQGCSINRVTINLLTRMIVLQIGPSYIYFIF